MRARVLAARERQQMRGGLNARLDGPALVDACALDDNAWQLLEKAGTKLGLSARGVNRVRKVARTIADLAGEAAVRWDHIAAVRRYTLDELVDGITPRNRHAKPGWGRLVGKEEW